MSESRLSVLTVVTLAGAAVLFISACSLVTSQYRARSLVAQIEKLQNEERRLNDDASELYMEISRAALPARKAGLGPATSRNTVVLEYKPVPSAAAPKGNEQ